MSLLDGYMPGNTYCEMIDGGEVRQHYAYLAHRLAELTPEDMEARARWLRCTSSGLVSAKTMPIWLWPYTGVGDAGQIRERLSLCS